MVVPSVEAVCAYGNHWVGVWLPVGLGAIRILGWWFEYPDFFCENIPFWHLNKVDKGIISMFSTNSGILVYDEVIVEYDFAGGSICVYGGFLLSLHCAWVPYGGRAISVHLLILHTGEFEYWEHLLVVPPLTSPSFSFLRFGFYLAIILGVWQWQCGVLCMDIISFLKYHWVIHPTIISSLIIARPVDTWFIAWNYCYFVTDQYNYAFIVNAASLSHPLIPLT